MITKGLIVVFGLILGAIVGTFICMMLGVIPLC